MRKLMIRKPIVILAVLTILVSLVGTIAIFTDRVEGNASISTVVNGVDITPKPDPAVRSDDPTKPTPENYVDSTPTDPSDDLTNWWLYLNAKATANFNPGDKMTLNYILANQGDLAVDVRETFIITSSQPLNENAPEFRLFTGFTQDPDTGCNTGVGVVSHEERLSETQYKYTVDPYILSSEKETVDSNPVELGREYYLVYDINSSNSFQGATCTVEYVVEAKQHTNGGEADWVVATTGTLELPVSGTTLPVVPAGTSN